MVALVLVEADTAVSPPLLTPDCPRTGVAKITSGKSSGIWLEQASNNKHPVSKKMIHRFMICTFSFSLAARTRFC
jgi:hypothetical protein